MFESLLSNLKFNSIKAYLLMVNLALVLFLIVFQNVGFIPFNNIGDFTFFALIGLLLALYRPGWSFVFFVGTIALENINLAPKGFILMLRPYQILGLMTFAGILVQYFSKRLPFSLPRFHWTDGLVLLFGFSGFVSAIFSAQRGASLKQSLVALSFIFLYALVRIYIQSLDDLKRIVPFFIGGGVAVAIYSIWQNFRFSRGLNHFEVMAGRPNGTFTEPDWLGIYLVFLISILFAIIYYQTKNTRIFNFKFLIFKQFSITKFLNYVVLAIVFIALILTVSRSAWLGAVIVTLGFLKVTLLDGSLKYSNWKWRQFLLALRNIALVLLFSFAVVYAFHLTTFQLFNRAQSTGGLQKITVACPSAVNTDVPILKQGEVIKNMDDLNQYACRHINLEDIENELAHGYNVLEVYRPDPNVNIRAEIYQKSWQQIKTHPVLGIGWGSISKILGTDERGAGLNTSNIFLETWLGAGIVGFISLSTLLVYIFYRGTVFYLKGDEQKRFIAIALLLPWAAIVVPNLFNAGIFLGFVWVYFAIAVSLLSEKK